MKPFKLFAALREDTQQGWVWLQNPNLPARSIVKIKNPDNGKVIYCESLQIDRNFLNAYNQSPRISINNPQNALVINGWYRAALGGLSTQSNASLDIKPCKSWWSKFRTCTCHPQIVVRVAAKLGLISVVLGLLGTVLGAAGLLAAEPNIAKDLRYPIVDTGQARCYDNSKEITCPEPGNPFYGQDAHYIRNAPSYSDNNNGTITDRVTGLIWQKAYEVMTYEEAIEKVKTFTVAKHTDWRIPTIKELYSLILFSGVDVSSREISRLPGGGVPFLDTDFFNFTYGSNGPRIIDVQIPSSTFYQGTTMGGQATVFGVNFADGRIKGYPITDPRSHSGKKFTVRFVRGNHEYGENNFKDNQNGTISDLATGLMWQQSDSGKAMSWEDALGWAQQKNKEQYLGYRDWRLPNAKELQSIVDYSRSPQKTNSAAINPLFKVSQIRDEGGKTNYPFYWSSTTHKHIHGGRAAVYICFGEALGFFKPPFSSGPPKLQDVHGAGAQRSDPKIGNPNDFPQGYGPQGDVIRIYHYVRLVRDISNSNVNK